MYTIIKNKPYLIEGDKMFAVNISTEKGIEKVNNGAELPKNYNVFTLREIKVKFGIKEGQPYYHDKEKFERELAEVKAELEAEAKKNKTENTNPKTN